MNNRLHSKGLFALCLLSVSVAAEDSKGVAEQELERLVVTASQQSLDEVVQPIKVLDRAALQQSSGSTLGEILETLPGITNASFGSGVGRPVVRGLAGNRVKVAVNGKDAADVSAMSNDHAPMAEAANAEQVEVIYGPGTLLFGSGAIGGVINLVDERIHQVPLIDGSGHSIVQSQVSQSTSSVSSGFETSASLDAGIGRNWVFHFDGFVRESQDYDSPEGAVNNTQTNAQGFSSGLSHIRDNGHSAVAVSLLDYDYGVPNPENSNANVTPFQFRVDGEYQHYFQSPFLESMLLQVSVIDYEHDELTDDLVVGYFDKQNLEVKSVFTLSHDWMAQSKLGVHANLQELVLCHDHGGCEGVPNYSNLNWDGTLGNNLQNNAEVDDDGNTLYLAHDTPMPLTDTLDLAGFWIYSGDWDMGVYGGKQEFAVRLDQRTIQLDPVSIRPASRQDASYYEDYNFLALTASAGWTWLTENQKYGLSLARTERAPQADEMFWNGDHHATFSFQLDNPDLVKEIAYTMDLTWQLFMDDYQIDAAVYYYDFDGFIYNKRQPFNDPNHQNPVYRHVQEDAYLTGFELAWQKDVLESVTLVTSLDHTTGRLKSGDNRNLPRIPPMSALVGVSWDKGSWLLKGDIRLYAEQDSVGENEVATDAYQTLNGFVGYQWALSGMTIDAHLKGNNLTDELGRNHVSYLKEVSPVQGRNISLDVRLTF
jgi:iron complex outermembrane receptor protein